MQKVMTATFILLGVEERNLKVGRWCIQTCLKKPLKELRKKIWSDKTSGLLKQVSYNGNHTFVGIQGWSRNTGGLYTQVDLTDSI